MTNVVCIFISMWAITLSVLQYRAMREPLDVGRIAEVPTLFLCRKNKNQKLFVQGCWRSKFNYGNEKQQIYKKVTKLIVS